MLMTEFARSTGLSTDTVRFYVRRGLLKPGSNGLGGRHPYQVFTDEHVRAVHLIRMAKSLGLSLEEIARLGREHRAGALTTARSVEILTAQLVRLKEKADELDRLAAYLRTKIAWLAGGRAGAEPELDPRPDADAPPRHVSRSRSRSGGEA